MNKPILNNTFMTGEGALPSEELQKDYNEETMHINAKVKNNAQETHVTINDINTFMAHKDELCLRGVNDNGEDITVWFNSYEFLKWIDKKHIKETLTKYINQI